MQEKLLLEACRLCLRKLESEFDMVILNGNEAYTSMVKDLLCIEILTDPTRDNFICSSCRQTLDDFSAFRSLCQENDVLFRSQLQISSAIPDNVSKDKPRWQDEIFENGHKVNLEIVSPNFDPPDPVHEKSSKPQSVKRKHPTIACTQCGKMVSKNNMAAHVETHQECRVQFPCANCDKVYTDANNLKKHINTHTKSAIYRCEECDKSFDRTDCLRKHRKIMHSDERDHVCTVCGKGYALKQSLTQHLKSAHSNTKTKECMVCGMLFKFNNELKMHMTKHTKEKQHSCPMCSKQFTRAYYLNVHMKSIHTND
nr:PR domain zinc finger protein 5-like [Aedes albopictus]